MGSRRSGRVAAAIIAAAALAATAMPASATSPASAAPPPLSRDTTPNDLSSSYGSGDFGQWHGGQVGLPAYRYIMDQATDPRAQQVETGSPTTFHKVGNDAHQASASNDGYT